MPKAATSRAVPDADPKPAVRTGGNADFEWDLFDPEAYVDHNYGTFRDDDRRIIQQVRDFFATKAATLGPETTGIDVGSGANIYPALSMLPFCRGVTLWEYGLANVTWLKREVRKFGPRWDPFWHVLQTRRSYRRVERPRDDLRRKAVVTKGDLFRLPRRQWGMGTMFFVAESMSDREREFNIAVERFIGSLTPGAPFAAAFMQDSTGYYVGPHRFPAVAVSKPDVEQCLAASSDDLQVHEVRSAISLREGYHGMLLALGTVNSTRR